MSYTPEPWFLADRKNSNNASIIYSADGVVANASEENSRRIVSCVNACSGIATEIIEQNSNKVSDLLTQRDELLAAIKIAQDALAHCKADIGYSSYQDKAAIAINSAIELCERKS